MKAFSIKQPWASLIAHGIKDIENRTWRTHFRGRIYIHSSAKMSDLFKGKELAFTGPQWNVIPKEFSFIENREAIFISSAVIGEVDIVDCVINHPSVWAEKTQQCGNTIDNEPLYKGQIIYNWVLANPILYDEPILNVKGKLSFWDFNPNQP